LHSSDYPKMRWKNALVAKPFWGAYIGPFTSITDAGTVQGNLATNGVACTFAYPAGG
jgi:hypothetical protein